MTTETNLLHEIGESANLRTVPRRPLVDRDQLIRTITRLKGKGTQKDLADRLQVSPAFLSDVINGNREPGESLLEALGLERRVTYVPKKK
jgi:hypothetical protein